MTFLGLVVAAAAVAIGVGVVLGNNGPAELTIYGQPVSGLTTQWQLFLAGAAVAIVFMAGMTIMTLGMGRSIRQRRELRELRDEHAESMTTMEMERRHLQRELAQARRNGTTGTYPSQGGTTGSYHSHDGPTDSFRSQGYMPRSR
jgi:hypothetical protein